MSERSPAESDLMAWLERDAYVRPPDALLGEVIERTAATRRRPSWLIPERWFPMETTARFGAVPRTVLILATLGLALLLAAALAVGAQPSQAPYPQGPGAFTTTAPLNTPRAYHAAVPLPDGRVLVAGGRDTTFEEIDSAESWDPATGTFTPLASRSPAGEVVGVPLADGRALIVGRTAAAAWDPEDGAFHATGPLMHPYREAQSLILLADGRALLVGGGDINGNPIARAEVYDPATNAWSVVGEIPGSALSLLPDGRVLLVAEKRSLRGHLSGPTETAVWDPASGALSPGPDLITPRGYGAAATLADGRVLIIGGMGETPDIAVPTAEVYDPAMGAFAPAGTLANPRTTSFTATRLPDGRVLVVGGNKTSFENPVGPAEAWDPTTATFSPAATLIEARSGHTATLMPDGSVLVIGGWEGEVDAPIPMADSEIWAPGPSA